MTNSLPQYDRADLLSKMSSRGMKKMAARELTVEDVYPHVKLAPDEERFVRHQIVREYDPDTYGAFTRGGAKKKAIANVRKDARREFPELLEHEATVTPIQRNLALASQARSTMWHKKREALMGLQNMVRLWIPTLMQLRAQARTQR
jgi:hypothetical protein